MQTTSFERVRNHKMPRPKMKILIVSVSKFQLKNKLLKVSSASGDLQCELIGRQYLVNQFFPRPSECAVDFVIGSKKCHLQYSPKQLKSSTSKLRNLNNFLAKETANFLLPSTACPGPNRQHGIDCVVASFPLYLLLGLRRAGFDCWRGFGPHDRGVLF